MKKINILWSKVAERLTQESIDSIFGDNIISLWFYLFNEIEKIAHIKKILYNLIKLVHKYDASIDT